jgi:L-lactate dehydrogenase complex protein LldE
MSRATLGFSAIHTIIFRKTNIAKLQNLWLNLFKKIVRPFFFRIFVNYTTNVMKIGLFIPCYVDALFPEAGIATLKLLQHLGLDVTYPEKQTCCGQPMANAGFQDMAIPLAKKFDEMFKDFDYVVAPSASCAAFVRVNHPELLSSEHRECQSAGKTTDIVEFLHDVMKIKSLPGSFPHVVSVHNSCHGVRELGLSSPSEQNIPQYNKIIDLLQLKEGITVKEPERKDECCGFGGMFSVEEPDVAIRMGTDKIERHMATGAEYITGPDSSCLMHMQGLAKRQNKDIKFIHVAEILAAGLD